MNTSLYTLLNTKKILYKSKYNIRNGAKDPKTGYINTRSIARF